MNINSTDYIQQLLKTISPDEKIEINNLGEIKIVHKDSTGKKKTKKAGNIFLNMEESPVVKFRTTSFVSISTPSFKSYRDFGKNPPKRIVKDYNSDVAIGIYLTLLDILPVILGKFTDQNKIKYDTKKVGDYIGFYAYDKLQFVDSLQENKRYYPPEIPVGLNTQKFESIEKVK